MLVVWDNFQQTNKNTSIIAAGVNIKFFYFGSGDG
jgi:hypothetical protein